MTTDAYPVFRIHRSAAGEVRGRLEASTLASPAPGEVVIAVRYSSINYKDVLAATGAGPILRQFPLVGGIDLAGEVVESADRRIRTGTDVLVCGCGLSETHDGGYARFARVAADWVEPIPPGLDCRSAMGLGTAGLAAALAIQRIETNGQQPQDGPLLVTGASGGVGSLAVNMLAARGYDVAAMTGRPGQADYLRGLGAATIVDRRSLEPARKPLERAVWGGAIDTAGGDVLATLAARTRPWGNIACVGLAAGTHLTTTVLPLILRGISLLGINTVTIPPARRRVLWQRLGRDLRPPDLERIVSSEIRLEDLPGYFDGRIERPQHGRTLVSIAPAP